MTDRNKPLDTPTFDDLDQLYGGMVKYAKPADGTELDPFSTDASDDSEENDGDYEEAETETTNALETPAEPDGKKKYKVKKSRAEQAENPGIPL